MSEWISVKHRLPPIDKQVLVWNDEYSDSEFIRMGFYDPSSYTKTGWRCDEYMDLYVTHWMELPNPPERLNPETEDQICYCERLGLPIGHKRSLHRYGAENEDK